MSRRRSGIDPLAYLGVEPSTPPDLIVDNRTPTVNDSNYNIGTLWVYPFNQQMWFLSQFLNGAAIWTAIDTGTAGATIFPADAGVANAINSTLNILGAVGGVLRTTGAGGTISVELINGAAGQLLIGGGVAPTWASLVSGDASIVITPGANSIDLSVAGGVGATSFPTNAGIAAPVLGVLRVFGGSNMNTAASGPNTVQVNLNNSILLPITNTAGDQGVIALGTVLATNYFMHGYGTNNTFLGNQAGSLTLTTATATDNVGIGTDALDVVTTGGFNTAVGSGSLDQITTGSRNVSIGETSLTNLITGNDNISIGRGSGSQYTGAESTNILIGHVGSTGTSSRIYIGTAQTTTTIAGIYNQAVGGTNAIVYIDNTGKLGTTGGSGSNFASSFATDVGGPAVPLAGTISFTAGSNISTNGATANTVKVNLVNSPSVSGSVTAATGLIATAGGIAATGTSTINTAGALGTSIGNVLSTTTVGGATLVNNSVNANTSINTGTSTGTLALGNSLSTTTVLGATNINVTGATTTTIGNTGATTALNGPVNVNASINANTNINTGTSTGTLALGNSLSTTTVLGATNINATGAALTTIGTGGTGIVHIGNATGNTLVTGTLTSTAGITANTGNITASAGNMSASSTITAGTGLIATTGGLTVTAGNTTLTPLAAVRPGTVRSSTAGVLSALIDPAVNGQLLISSAAGVPIWASLTSSNGTITITTGANTIDLIGAGGGGGGTTSFTTDVGGPAAPTGGGNINFTTGSNISTNGATANTVKINLVNSPSVSGSVTAGTGLIATTGGVTATAGGLTATAGGLTVTAGNTTLTPLAAATAGFVRSSTAGLLSALADTANNGYLLISAAAGAPIWAPLTSAGGSVTITRGVNSINLEAAGVAALTQLSTDVGGPVNPLAGNINVTLGSNISTDGNTANTLKVNLVNSPSVSGTVTAATGLIATSGNVTVGNTAASAAASDVDFQKSRTGGIITSGDALGLVTFKGHDGVGYIVGSQVTSTNSGTVGVNRIASDLKFFTHPDSVTASTLRMTIAPTGEITVAAPDSGTAFTVTGGGATITGATTVAGTTLINNSVNSNTSINTGTSTGTTAIGNLLSTNTITGLTNTINGTTNINTGNALVTTIGTGGTGVVNIGNATGNTAVTGSLTASTGLTATAGGITATGTSSINTAGGAATTIGTGGTGAVNIGNATGNTAVTGTLTATGNIDSSGGTVRGQNGLIATTGGLSVILGGITSVGTTTLSSLGAGVMMTNALGVVSSTNLGVGVVQSDAAGVLTASTAAAGRVLISTAAGTAPVWATLTAGANVTITPASGSITIAAAGGGGGGGATTFVTSSGTATVSGVTMQFISGANTNTDGATNVVHTNLNTSIVQPVTNASGSEGLYSLGTSLQNNPFMHGYGTRNTFLGQSAGGSLTVNFNMTGTDNTGIGARALRGALGGAPAISGGLNTGVGADALVALSTGTNNVAVGRQALPALTSGARNVAIGQQAGLLLTSSTDTVLIGDNAGNSIAAIGNGNVVIGSGAMPSVTTGANNIVIGYQAGTAITNAASNNILIASPGVVGDVATIRIGSAQTEAHISGVYNVAVTTNTPKMVVINSQTQLGAAGNAYGTLGQLLYGTSATGAPQWFTPTSPSGSVKIGTTGTFDVGGSTFPSFLAYQPSNTGSVTGDGTVYTLGSSVAFTEVYDVGGNFTTSPARFTAPVTGKYLLQMQVTYANIQWTYVQPTPPPATQNIPFDPMNIITSNRNYEYIESIAYDQSTQGTAFRQSAGFGFSVVADMDATDTCTYTAWIRNQTAVLSINIKGSAAPLYTFVSGHLVSVP